MFVTSHLAFLSNAINYSNQLPKENGFLGKTERFLEKQYALRVVAPAAAAFGAVSGFLTDSIRSVRELSAFVVSFKAQSIKNAALYSAASVVDLVALPVIGLVGVASPDASKKLAEKTNSYVQKYLTAAPTDGANLNCNVCQRIFSVISGITDSITDAVSTVDNTARALLASVVDQNSTFTGNTTLVTVFKGFTDGVSQSITKLFAGVHGAVSQASRNYVFGKAAIV